jgi:hypothetical protein
MRRTSALKPTTVRLSRRRRYALYLIGALSWLSGVAWLLLHFFLQRQGEFGPEPHPLLPWALKTHGAAAFGLLWMGGLLWGVHMRPRLRSGRWRRTGIGLGAFWTLLALSGYLLYYGSADTRETISVVHWVLGLLAPALLLAHVVGAWRLRRVERVIGAIQSGADQLKRSKRASNNSPPPLNTT